VGLFGGLGLVDDLGTLGTRHGEKSTIGNNIHLMSKAVVETRGKRVGLYTSAENIVESQWNYFFLR
jgi:hypothetical protein